MNFSHKKLQEFIANARKACNKTQEEFGSSLGVSRSVQSQIEIGDIKPSIEYIVGLIRLYNISPDIILQLSPNTNFNQKSKPNSKPTGKPNSEIATLSGVQPVIVTVDEVGNDNIVLVGVKAAAGYISHRLEPTFIKDLPAFKLPGGELRNASYRAFEIEGDSMHDTLNPGDWVIARLMEGGANEIRNGYVHVIVTQSDIVVKRCLNRVKDSNKIVCKSDNDAYPDSDINVQEILEVWHVRKLISGHLPARNRDLKLIVGRLEADMLELKNWKEKVEHKLKPKP